MSEHSDFQVLLWHFWPSPLYHVAKSRAILRHKAPLEYGIDDQMRNDDSIDRLGHFMIPSKRTMYPGAELSENEAYGGTVVLPPLFDKQHVVSPKPP